MTRDVGFSVLREIKQKQSGVYAVCAKQINQKKICAPEFVPMEVHNMNDLSVVFSKPLENSKHNYRNRKKIEKCTSCQTSSATAIASLWRRSWAKVMPLTRELPLGFGVSMEFSRLLLFREPRKKKTYLNLFSADVSLPPPT